MANTLSLDLTDLILNGEKIQGFTDDAESLMIDTVGDFYETKYGADGLHEHGRKGNIYAATLTIKLLTVSPSVLFLQEIVEATRNGGHVSVNGACTFADGTTATIQDAVLAKPPASYTLGNGVSKEMEYVFNVGRFNHIVSGRNLMG